MPVWEFFFYVWSRTSTFLWIFCLFVSCLVQQETDSPLNIGQCRMNGLIFYCLLCFIPTVLTEQSSSLREDFTAKLYTWLSTNTNKNVGPWRDRGDTLNVTVDFDLYSINDLVRTFFENYYFSIFNYCFFSAEFQWWNFGVHARVGNGRKTLI